MAKIETLTAYRCTFSYIQRNNPLKEELKDKIAEGLPPEYTFANFIEDFSKFTASLAVGKSTERAILLPEDNIYPRKAEKGVNKWRIVPYAGKQGKPFRIIKTSNGKEYNFGSDSAALYEHNIFIYQTEDSAVAVFHRQSGSGCKSVFLEVANKMLKEKGIKLDMELYLPLLPANADITPTRIQLQYVRNIKSSDITENTHKRKRREVIQDLGINLESHENGRIKDIIRNMQMGKINQDTAFARIISECPNAENYNDAEIQLRIGKRYQKVRWNEFDSVMGNYDITEKLHKEFHRTGDFIKALTELTDAYYNSIIAEENENAG